MTARNFSNTAVEAELSTSVASGTTGFQVSAVTGFPSVPFTAVIAEGQADEEVILVTNLSGTTLTATRGYNGTTAVAHSQGASITHAAVAMDFQEANDHVNETTTAHGLTLADVLTTTNTKTVTGKTLDGDDNTFTDIPASAVKNRPINPQTGTTYTFVLADARKIVTGDNASAQTFTVPPQASVTWLADAAIGVAAIGAGTITIVGGSGVTVNGGDLTFHTSEGGTLLRKGSDDWWFLKGGGAIPFGSASGGTATTYSAGGTDYAVNSFTSDGTLVVGTAGLFDVLLVGGGGGGGQSYGASGGAGAFIELKNLYLAAGSYTVTIGLGGPPSSGSSVGNVGGDTLLHWPNGSGQPLIARGGGYGGYQSAAGGQGGCGGGGGNTNAGGQSIQSLGYYSAGGTGVGSTGCGGGGGAGGAGTGTTGGAGRQSSLRTGAAVYYCASGQPEGSSAAPGTGYSATANTGMGGSAAVTGQAGIVIVRYAV